MSVTRKRSDLALGPDRALGVQGIRVIDVQSARQSGSTDPVVTYTGAQRGDLILAIATMSSAGTHSITCPGLTFTTISTQSQQLTVVTIAQAWNPDDTASRVVTLASTPSTTGLVVLVLRGVDPVSPVDVSPLHSGHEAATTLTVPSIETLTPRALAVLAVSSRDDNTLTAAAPWSVASVGDFGGVACFGVWTRTVAAPGAIGTTDVTETANGPDAAHSAVLAVRALAG